MARGRALLHVDPKRHIAFLVVVAGCALGGWLVYRHHPFEGLGCVGVSLLVASAARTVLPARYAGLLVNRSRSFDTFVLGFLGAAILVLVFSLHAGH